eukprot:2969511-Pleurochrysis_carterae.AAC.1
MTRHEPLTLFAWSDMLHEGASTRLDVLSCMSPTYLPKRLCLPPPSVRPGHRPSRCAACAVNRRLFAVNRRRIAFARWRRLPAHRMASYLPSPRLFPDLRSVRLALVQHEGHERKTLLLPRPFKRAASTAVSTRRAASFCISRSVRLALLVALPHTLPHSQTSPHPPTPSNRGATVFMQDSLIQR